MSVPVALMVGLGALATSCSTGAPEETLADDFLCQLPTPAARDAVLKAVGADEVSTTIFARPSTLVQRVEDDLRHWTTEKGALPTDVCLFQRVAGEPGGSVRISFQWATPEKGKVAGRPLRDARRYVVNGLPAEANEGDAKLSFSCVMPGDLRGASRQAQLVGWVALTGGPRQGLQSDGDVRHVTLAYLMAQRAVEALGCENEPLRGEPVVKPGT